MKCSQVDVAAEDLRDELERLRRRSQAQRAAIRRLDDQLRLAGQVQRSLRAPIPVAAGVDIHTLCLPVGPVSGDLYEIVRMDDSHIGLTLADATGHDLSASLLSEFFKCSLYGRNATEQRVDLIDPAGVLAGANRDILNADLEECQFLSAVYAVYHEPTRIIRWARGGAPYPVLIRPGCKPRRLVTSGPLLGVLSQPRFEVAELQLQDDDIFILHSDGLNALLLSSSGEPLDPEEISQHAWFQRLGGAPLQQDLYRIEQIAADRNKSGPYHDDVTIVALQVCDKPLFATPS